jgi:hypothetical protein
VLPNFAKVGVAGSNPVVRSKLLPLNLWKCAPKIVVSGHQRVGAPNDPKTIGESQQYLRDFSRIVESEETVEGIVSKMFELHPDRDNPRVVWHSAREAMKKREQF